MKPTVARGEVWINAVGQRRFVTSILRNTDGTETVEYREGDFKPAKKMLVDRFVAQHRKEPP